MIPKRTPKRVTGSSPWQNRRPGLARNGPVQPKLRVLLASRACSHRPVNVGAPGLRGASGSLTSRANRQGHRAIPTRQRGRSEADTTRPPHDGAPRDTSMDDPWGCPGPPRVGGGWLFVSSMMLGDRRDRRPVPGRCQDRHEGAGPVARRRRRRRIRAVLATGDLTGSDVTAGVWADCRVAPWPSPGVLITPPMRPGSRRRQCSGSFTPRNWGRLDRGDRGNRGPASARSTRASRRADPCGCEEDLRDP